MVPTPVGPAERDPNDPDFWDWDPPDERSSAQRRPIVTIVAVVAIAAILLLLLVSIL
jgi:hypothetical protein